ncbi:SDR family oxidoreductase [Parabacteroides faecis]|uniref:SDR family oxidoreductase n=1 Tax=Parabacteroides faecis TaxID=1217282 RepID=UPI0021666E48|nr:SDR family oxidoreductase [Parabacteroides faecis]MCS2892743.1 SDR family oxidoreductase [Parabacteroides faecis]
MVRKIANYIRNFIRYVKKGGLVEVHVSQISQGSILKDKKVLVTGGSSGFGYAIAEKFLKEGALVIITGRNAEKLKGAESNLKKIDKDRIHSLVWDLNNMEEMPSSFHRALQIYNGIDIFVNNAGVWSAPMYPDYTPDEYDRIMNTNLKGLFFMMQEEGRYMETQGIRGKIINITSICGRIPSFDFYNASKHGADCITMGLARKLASKGIIINGIAPGIALTDINIALKNRYSHDDNEFCAVHPTDRFVRVEEVAELATFLASDAANNIVGQIIAVDGGTTIGRL